MCPLTSSPILPASLFIPQFSPENETIFHSRNKEINALERVCIGWKGEKWDLGCGRVELFEERESGGMNYKI